MTKRLLQFVLAMILLTVISCGTTTIGFVVAGLGIAGAGLETFCAINACPNVLSMYGPIIVSEAVTDIKILESGVTTTVKIAEIVSNVQNEIAQGQAITGLSPEEQNIITPILNALSSFLNMLSGLTPVNPSSTPYRVVKIPPFTSKDKAKIAEMRVRINHI